MKRQAPMIALTLLAAVETGGNLGEALAVRDLFHTVMTALWLSTFVVFLVVTVWTWEKPR